MPIRRILATSVSLFLLNLTWPALAQVNTGELRLKVTDPTGLGISASITISSSVTQYRTSLPTSNTGEVDLKILPYGIYLIRAESEGFAATTETVEVRSALPSEHTVKLSLALVNTSVQVSDVAPLIDPHRPSSVMQIGAKQIQDRETSLPGRSVQDLVDTQGSSSMALDPPSSSSQPQPTSWLASPGPVYRAETSTVRPPTP